METSLDLIQLNPSSYRLIQWIPDVPRDLSWLSNLAGDLYRQTMTDEDQDQDLDRLAICGPASFYFCNRDIIVVSCLGSRHCVAAPVCQQVSTCGCHLNFRPARMPHPLPPSPFPGMQTRGPSLCPSLHRPHPPTAPSQGWTL